MAIPYIEYFGLTEKPFGLTPDPFFYFESQSHKEAVDHLSFFLAQKEGFAVIYGDVGLGKTTLARIFLGSLDTNRYNTVFIINPIMDDTGFLQQVLKELNIERGGQSRKEYFDVLTQFLIDDHARGKETVIVIDEAQLLSSELLEFIRVLSNIETEKEKIVHIILFAQPEIIETLRDERMRYLSQRISVIYQLKPFADGEVERYVAYRLIKAGSKGVVRFDADALKRIGAVSMGCPRIINRLCDRSLLALYAESGTTVNGAVIDRVLAEKDLSIHVPPAPEGTLLSGAKTVPSRMYYTVLAIALIIVAGLIFTYKMGWIRTGTPVAANGGSRPGAAMETQKAGETASQSKPAPVIDKKRLEEATVKVPLANVRAMPGLDARIVGVLRGGDTVTITEKISDDQGITWYKTTISGGKSGWISRNVLK